MIDIDVWRDWQAIVAQQLRDYGFTYDNNQSLRENTVCLFNAQRRIPAAKPRKAVFAKGFLVPESDQQGFSTLLQVIDRGDVLLPYLSSKITGPNYHDGLLDDWGIQHLHMGMSPHKNGRFGSKQVAFAIIRDEAVFFITTLPHGKGYGDAWINANLIQVVHDNWPSLLAWGRFQLEPSELTAAERKECRASHTNVSISTSDGTTYMAPGGGMMINGDSMRDIGDWQGLCCVLHWLGAEARRQEPAIRRALGFGETQELTIRVQINTNGTLELFESGTRTGIRLIDQP